MSAGMPKSYAVDWLPMRALVLALLLSSATAICAQSCPVGDSPDAKEASHLHGVLQYHDELREWIGLHLDRPACGERVVQLVFLDRDSGLRWRQAKALGGCGVTVTGTLYQPSTGYYSAALAISDPKLEPDASCHPRPLDPDISKAQPLKGLSAYHASIIVEFAGAGHITVTAWQDDPKHTPLQPWQAYVHKTLTGSGELMWVECGEEFAVAQVTRTPPAKEDDIVDDPALGFGVSLDTSTMNVIALDCRRK